MARREIGRFKENRTDTDALRAQAQSEMLDAMKRAKDLPTVIGESSSKAKSHTREIQVLKKSRGRVGTREDQVLAIGDVDNKKMYRSDERIGTCETGTTHA
ncbi:protein PLASTID MOVEMENT IMPAIRED 2-like [Pyrus ussuriensis x Pyrus communis]|uniref:Protein PLASTID MOVEMENT IMPAIRED 2-like n=1 Tax=Pyrus ussuriensis x Pyrus communis TaxID=2448454 RepID=A0A5N5G935_9ROSA|nr:protein PLASTID MOVEMENT IMPAIRED 2-like [Pyrus ussuriensis x Pyrus communis]